MEHTKLYSIVIAELAGDVCFLCTYIAYRACISNRDDYSDAIGSGAVESSPVNSYSEKPSYLKDSFVSSFGFI